MKTYQALDLLRRFFLVSPEIFAALKDEEIIEWAMQVYEEKSSYKLRTWQHLFLVGDPQYMHLQ